MSKASLKPIDGNALLNKLMKRSYLPEGIITEIQGAPQLSVESLLGRSRLIGVEEDEVVADTGYCSFCGKLNFADNKFCGKCGRIIEAVEPAVSRAGVLFAISKSF